jgi:hypothetical protein
MVALGGFKVPDFCILPAFQKAVIFNWHFHQKSQVISKKPAKFLASSPV